jgi:hypothetical protein
MVGAAKIYCKNNGNYKFLTDSEIKELIKAIRSILDAEECLFKFLALRVVKEIERDTLSPSMQNSFSNTIEFVQKNRSRSVDSKPKTKV